MLDVYPVYLKLGWKHKKHTVSGLVALRNTVVTHTRAQRLSRCLPRSASKVLAIFERQTKQKRRIRILAERISRNPAHTSRQTLRTHTCIPIEGTPARRYPPLLAVTRRYSPLRRYCVSGCVSAVYLFVTQIHVCIRVSVTLYLCISHLGP